MMELLAQAVEVVKDWGPLGVIAAVLAQMTDRRVGTARSKSKQQDVEGAMREGFAAQSRRIEELCRQSDDLHDWHKPDTNGEQGWKNARMADAIDKMMAAVENQTRLMERLVPVLDRLEQRLSRDVQ